MVIFNMSLNNRKVAKTGFIIILIIVSLILVIGIYNVLFNKKEQVGETIKLNPVQEIPASNYTNILKEVHENLDAHIGQRIKFTGFIYRLYDFNDNQFVLARQMIVSSDMQAVVVGFLCDLPNGNKYKDGCWVEIEGEITKGEYHGEIPVIEVEAIKEVKIPSDEYVYPPDNTYVPTSVTL